MPQRRPVTAGRLSAAVAQVQPARQLRAVEFRAVAGFCTRNDLGSCALCAALSLGPGASCNVLCLPLQREVLLVPLTSPLSSVVTPFRWLSSLVHKEKGG